ncbi:MAG: endopeptidase La [Chloroflexi bacterium]|nr:endopeptidase La [Chloroflexota bacterium]
MDPETTRNDPPQEHELSPVPEELPILPSGEAVVFPAVVVPLVTRNTQAIQLLEEAFNTDKLIGIFAERAWIERPDPEHFFSVGTVAVILRMMRLPDGAVQALLQGLSRIQLQDLTQQEPYLRARIAALVEPPTPESLEREALCHSLVTLFQKLLTVANHLPKDLEQVVVNLRDPSNLADFVCANLNLDLKERQEVLETLDVLERLRRVMALLSRELEIVEVGNRIQSQIKEELDQRQKEFYLREQLKAIQRELGETEDANPDVREFRRRLAETTLPEEAQREADRELERLTKMSPASAEYIVSRTFLEWLVSLPWHTLTTDRLDLARAARILDEDHYDMERVKNRILDFLAVRSLKPDSKGPILCFVGPPGVGKTSMGQSIARALGRKFLRLSLGGIRDEAEIRGHRRTYIGALPGRIIQGIRRAESRNPVLMLDEIDKLGADFRGDPAAALLEVLDPEQNHTFVDHYLDVPFDLSRVLFITTANVLDTVPPALRDRMEVIEIPGYSEPEKLEIARRYLVPRQIHENGLHPDRFSITEGAIRSLIRDYTREAGVRNLEREIGTVCRRVARRVAEGYTEPTAIDAPDLSGLLGKQRFRHTVAEQGDEVGVATGLAVTPVGGDVLFIEASLVPGTGQITLTGSLGDVMQESARAALTYVRSRAGVLGAPLHFYQKHDLHIHVPAGATPKDGPSAGVTITVALLSAVCKRPVRKDIAMTGEITLRGKVLPVGGIKEKVLAAHRAGIARVILPRENERDLEEVPEAVRRDLDLVLVESLDEVVPIALTPGQGQPRLVAAVA